MMTKAKEQLLAYAEKRAQAEKDKWNSGLKNLWYDWADLCDWLKENLK